MAANAEIEEAKLRLFHQWLQANGVELRGCTIRCSGPNRGFGVFFTADGNGHTSSSSDSEGVVMMVAPLDLAITPMSVLQDPVIGPRCRALFEEGDVDDRFLVMLYLTVERLRPDSPWKPYLDMLPNTFGNPLWFTEDELAELKGTTLYRATLQQRKKLQALYGDKVKGLVEELLYHYGESESVREVQYEDFLWANSIFWTRALNIPFPRSYVFPESPSEQDSGSVHNDTDSGAVRNNCLGEIGNGEHAEIVPKENENETSKSTGAVTVWVEGLVPGIDFCNHGLKAAATWEVDQTGSVTGVPTSMYLVLADQRIAEADKELYISYGNKGNEELLYLYGFVINSNPDDYLMVHYPMEAFQNVPFSDKKAKLLEIQKAELRCLLPRSLLELGILSGNTSQDGSHNKRLVSQLYNYSWCGQRKVPSYINQLVFPQDFLAALRTVAMREHELSQVTSLLEELVRSGEDGQPSDKEVEAAVWEACGDYGALELLVDLLRVKLMELEDGSGTEVCDAELLEKYRVMELENDVRRNDSSEDMLMSSNKYSSVVYRRGQKQLTSSFLREAEHALELCASEEP